MMNLSTVIPIKVSAQTVTQVMIVKWIILQPAVPTGAKSAPIVSAKARVGVTIVERRSAHAKFTMKISLAFRCCRRMKKTMRTRALPSIPTKKITTHTNIEMVVKIWEA